LGAVRLPLRSEVAAAAAAAATVVIFFSQKRIQVNSLGLFFLEPVLEQPTSMRAGAN